MNFKEMITNDQKYEFLHTNPNIKNRIILLTLGGSYAYGTNVETSDVDIRGIALNSYSDILGLSNFDQFENRETDTVIYSLNKVFRLLIQCNPNVIEMLGNQPDMYLKLTEEGQLLLDNRHLFLSQRAIKTFGGYAQAQLNRLLNGLGRNSEDSLQTNLLRSLQNSMQSFNSRYSNFRQGSINYYIDTSDTSDVQKEIYCDICLKHYPLTEFNGIIKENDTILKTYNKLNHRNTKKDISHLCKHAMHLVRLYLTGCEILENGTITTYRKGSEHKLLMDIRNQKYLTYDNKFNSDFFELLNRFQHRFEYACNNTNLPATPDIHKIESLIIALNLKSIQYNKEEMI